MHRWVVRSSLFCFVLLLPAVWAQPPKTNIDRIFYRDRTKGNRIVDLDGVLKESANGIQVVVGGTPRELVSPADIIRVDYVNPVGINKPDLLKAQTLEDGRDPAKAAAAYGDLLKKSGTNLPEASRRYLSFREAIWMARVADQHADDESFRPAAELAATKLAAVARQSKTSWEVWPTARTAARLYSELGDHAKAATLLGELGQVAGLPRDLRYEAQLAEAAALIRARQGLAVEGQLSRLASDKELPPGALTEKLAILRAVARLTWPEAGSPPAALPREVMTEIRKAVDQAKDPQAKALGYGLLGETLLAYGQMNEAMWEFLWVDTVFFQDRDEQVLAIRGLSRIFEQKGDKDRAAEFRDKLPAVRR